MMMKEIIPNPCFQKLTENNFCAKCNHTIVDYSTLSLNELKARIMTEKPFCGIFSQDQKFSLNQPIFNAILFSTLGLIPTKNYAQNNIPSSSSNLTIQFVKKEFELMIKAHNNFKDDYRLLINGKLIAEKIKSNQKIKIQFEVIKDQEFEISIHSNQYSVYQTLNYKADQLPKIIEIDRSIFNRKTKIRGKIAYPRQDQNENKK